MPKITPKLQWSPSITQSRLVLALKIAAIVTATLTIFFQDLMLIFTGALQNETTSYILAIPFIFAYLIYRKRKMLRAVIPLSGEEQPQNIRHFASIAGILLVTTAVLLCWHGSYTLTPVEYHMFTLPLFTAGLCLILFNPETLRHLAFPLAFLFFLMPPPSEILYAAGSTLQVLSAEASNAIVNAVGILSTITTEYGNPTIIITRRDGTPLDFTVDIACSGIYSLIGFLIFAVFIAYIIRDKPWKKLALFLIGLSLIYTLNITRITTILLIGYQYGEEKALQIFHLLSGWVLIFIGTLLLLVFSEKVLHTQIFAKLPQECSAHNPETNQDFCFDCGKLLKPAPIRFHRSDLIKMTTIIVSVILLMSIQVPVFAMTQDLAIVLIDTPTGHHMSKEILPNNSGYNMTFAYRARDFEKIAKQDMALMYSYTPTNQSQKLLFATVEIASALENLPKWEIFLTTGEMYPYGQQDISQIELKDVPILQNPQIIGRFFVFKYKTTNQTQAVLYWFESATFEVNSTTQQEHVEISLIAYPESPEELPLLENQMVILANTIASYWQPIKAWSQVAPLLSQEGAYLATVTSALLFIIIVLYALQTRKQRKANANAYKKLSKENKAVIQALHQTKTVPTAQNIAATYEKLDHKPITTDELVEKLQQAQETGLIKKQIINAQDEPVLSWKTQMTIPKSEEKA